MNCEECKDLLWLYLEDELTTAEANEIAYHIEHCAVCKEEMESIKKMKNMLDSLPEMELPEGYHKDLMGKLEQETETKTKVISLAERKKDKFQWKNMGLIAAAVCLVVVGGSKVNFFNTGMDSASSSAAPMAAAESRMMDEVAQEESAMEELEMAAGTSTSTTTTESMDMTTDEMAVSVDASQESALPYQEEWAVSVVDMEVFVADLGSLLAEVDGMITMVDMDAVDVAVSVEKRDAFLALLEQKMSVAVNMVEMTENKETFIRICCVIE